MLTTFPNDRILPAFPDDNALDPRSLLSRARDLEQQGHVETAVQLYALLGEQSREARDRLKAISGEGGLSAQRFEVLAGQFTGQVTDPAALFAMAGAQGTYRLVSAGLGKILGFAAEAGLFPIYHRFGDAALGRRTDWSSRALRNDTVGSFAVLGGLRLFGGLSRQAFQLGGGSRAWLPLYEQAGQYGGIVFGHGVESRLLSWIDPEFQSPNHGVGQTLIESLVTLIHFNGMGRILGPAGFPNPIRRMDSWLPPLRGLQLASEEIGLASGRQNSESSPTIHRNWVLSEGEGESSEAEAVRRRYKKKWDEMAAALEQENGVIKHAASRMGANLSAFHKRVRLARRYATPDMAIYYWVVERKEEYLSSHWQRIYEALESGNGNISEAVRILGMERLTVYRALEKARKEAPEDAPILKWARRLSSHGKAESKKRRGLWFMQALEDSNGDILAASRKLKINIKTFSFFLDELASPEGESGYGARYQRSLLETLARIRPGDNRILKLLQESDTEWIRYLLTQSLFSRNHRIQAVLENLVASDPSPLVRQGAQQALSLSIEQRLLLSFGNRFRHASLPALVRRSGVAKRVSQRRLKKMVHEGWVHQDESGLFGVSAGGQEEVARVMRQRVWDNLNLALETTRGYQRKAAQMLGVDGRTFRRYLHASIGFSSRDSRRGKFFKEPQWLAPADHPIHRWNNPEYYERARREHLRPTRIRRYRPLWEKMEAELERLSGDYDQAAQNLQLSNPRFRELLRLAKAYKWDPLMSWADARRIEAYETAKLERALSEEGEVEYGRFRRRIMLEALGMLRPDNERVLHTMEKSTDGPTRYFLTQVIFSENPRVRAVLEKMADHDPSPLVQQGARQALDLERNDRILMSFGKRNQTNATMAELMTRTGIEQDIFSSCIRELIEEGHVLQEGDEIIRLTLPGRLRVRQISRQRIWDNLNFALELTRGHQGKAAKLLGVNHTYLNTILQASMGNISDASPQKAYYRDPQWQAPPDHPILRWEDRSFVASLRRARFRDQRILRYQPVWDKILKGLNETSGDYDAVAERLGMTNRRFRSYLRLALDYKYAPLFPWANVGRLEEYDAAKRARNRQELHRKVREGNKHYLDEISPYQRIPTRDLSFVRPYRDLPEELKHEYVLRFQWGDELAGKRMERVYHQWLTYWSRRHKIDGLPMSDLYQAGVRGMLEAARRFDIHRGAKFTTYAWYFVFSYHIRLVKRALGATLSSRDYRIYREMVNLSRKAKEREGEVDFNEIARHLQVSFDKLEEIRQAVRARFATSWEGNANGVEGRGIQEVVPDPGANVSRDYLRSEMRTALEGFMASYQKRNDRVLPLDVLTADEERLQEIGNEQGMEFHEILTAKDHLRQELQNYLTEIGIEADFFE